MIELSPASVVREAFDRLEASHAERLRRIERERRQMVERERRRAERLARRMTIPLRVGPTPRPERPSFLAGLKRMLTDDPFKKSRRR